MISALLIPQAATAEKSALSMMVCNPALIGLFPWHEDHFLHPANKIILAALQAAAEAREPGDLVAITSRLEANGTLHAVGGAAGLTETLTTLVCGVPEQAGYYFSQLNSARAYRDAVAAVERALPDLRTMSVPIADIADRIGEVADAAGHRQRKTLVEQMDALYSELERREPAECFSVGLAGLDRHLGGGLHRKELGVVAGETSGGKSVVLGMAALAAARAGRSVAIFSLEMPAGELLKRLASNLAGLRIKPLHEHPSRAEMDRMGVAMNAIAALPLTIIDDMTALPEIEAEGRRLARLKKADLIVIDYLQLIEHSKPDNREQAVSEIARRMKNMALAANSAVLTASQLNEEGKLRESRAIGHHADQVFIIGDGEIRIAKNRRGPRDVGVDVTLRGELGRFEED
jgi:replicative DNA helicase